MSGSKEMSKGYSDWSDGRIFQYFMSNCGTFLPSFMQQNAWSSHLSCCLPHAYEYKLVDGSNSGSHSFPFIQIMKLQFGR